MVRGIYLPGIGASHRDFPAYRKIFDQVEIINYDGCVTLQDHLDRMDQFVLPLEENREEYVLIGHSLGANLVYHYISHRELKHIKGYSMIGGGPRFQPLKSWTTIFSLPSPLIGLVLVFIVLGAPFLFLIYGWRGMYQRVNVVDLFQREGISTIKEIYNKTLVPLLKDPKPQPSEIPTQMIRLPKDMLFPPAAVEETKKIIPHITDISIDRDLIHFSHHLDILVAAHVHKWLVDEEIIQPKILPFEMDYAMKNPRSIQVEVEGFELPRLPVILVLLPVVLFLVIHNFPDSGIANFIQDQVTTVISVLNLEGISLGLFLSVSVLTLTSISGYKWIIDPEFPKEEQTKLGSHPLVSIIVPMRNEARNIATCLTSLLHLQYPTYEIILVDGDSQDETVKIAQQAIAKHNTMEIPCNIVQEPPLPDDWIGKSWACWNGAQKAAGQYLLFTDADTFHHPDSLKEVMRVLQEKNLDGLSIIGKFDTGSFWEKTILPFFKALLLVLFGGRFTDEIGRTLAIGQYIMVNRETYHKFGGHESIKDEIAEDIHLATRIGAIGKYRVYNRNDFYQVRMYQSLNEIKEGLERNATESVGNSPWLAILASIGLIGWRIVPLALYPISLFIGSPPTISLSLLAFAVFTLFLNFVDASINDDPWYYGFLFPLGVIALVIFLINSSINKYSDQPRIWKGRQYSS